MLAIFQIPSYVLLSSEYGKQINIHTYRYYRVDPYTKTSDDQLIKCHLLKGGNAAGNDQVIQVPVSVVEEKKVKRGEALTDIGQRMYSYCIIRTSREVLRYGQVIQTSWEQNLVFEPVNAHSKVQVLTFDQETYLVKADHAWSCSLVCFLARPFEGIAAASVDKTDVEQLHQQLDQTQMEPSPDAFATAYRSSGRSIDDLKWDKPYSITNIHQRFDQVALITVINAFRHEHDLPPWADVTSIISPTTTTTLTKPKVTSQHALQAVAIQLGIYIEQIKAYFAELRDKKSAAQVAETKSEESQEDEAVAPVAEPKSEESLEEESAAQVAEPKFEDKESVQPEPEEKVVIPPSEGEFDIFAVARQAKDELLADVELANNKSDI